MVQHGKNSVTTLTLLLINKKYTNGHPCQIEKEITPDRCMETFPSTIKNSSKP